VKRIDKTPKVAVVEIDRYDWTRWPQSVCLRLQPTLKPACFRRIVRIAAMPSKAEALRANEAITSHLFQTHWLRSFTGR